MPLAYRAVVARCVHWLYVLVLQPLLLHGNCWTLEPDNDIHLWCLHYVYQSRINRHLQLFAEGWNRKPISTARNKTPGQLWFLGLYAVAQSDYIIAQEMNQAELQVSFPKSTVLWMLPETT